jgi:thiamine biosynthesis lipoprotein
MSEHDMSFQCMGTTVRLLVGPALDPALPSPADAAASARAYLEGFDRRLSRFREDSELCALNRDPRAVVPASRLLRAAVSAAVWAARETDGLVDPTLVGALEDVGYARSRAGMRAASLTGALAAAPPRRPARAHPHAAWRRVMVDDDAGVVRRPPGVRIDSGGTGKGLAADAVASNLRAYSRFVVDCGGDVRIGGPAAAADPYEVEVEHPVTRERAHVLRVASGAIATSGINSRLWETGTGYGHHLLDPSTGDPAWTGLVGVTALAPTALEAETLAKSALLSGPSGARRVLAAEGGLIVHESGDVELAGPLRAHVRPRVRLRRSAIGAAA